MSLDLILILLCIVINAFFSASEIAVVTARRSKIKQLIDEGYAHAENHAASQV